MRYMIGDDLSNNFFHLLKKNEKKKFDNRHCSI